MIPVIGPRLRHLPTAGQLRRFGQQLRGPNRSSAARAVVDGARVAWTLRRRGVRPLVTGISADRSVVDTARARSVSQAVDTGLDLLPIAATCLRRSLTLARELDRLDLAGTIHVGVRETDGAIEAHAWIQADSKVLNDDPALVATYTELAAGALERLAPSLR